MALAAGARCVRPREGQPPSRPRCRRHRRACGRPGSARPPSLHDHAAVPRLPHGGRRLLPLQVQVGVVGVHPLRRVLIAGTHEVARVSQREGVGPVEGEASGLGLGQAMAVVLESTAQHQALAHALWIGRPRSLGRWHLPQQVVSRLGGWGAVVRPRALRNGAVAAYRPWAVHPGPTAVGVPGRAPATRNGGGAAAISLLSRAVQQYSTAVKGSLMIFCLRSKTTLDIGMAGSTRRSRPPPRAHQRGRTELWTRASPLPPARWDPLVGATSPPWRKKGLPPGKTCSGRS
eukprot:COSAG01_NODE_992_length_12250_cov_14.174356_13_plen_289_part_00